MKWPWVSRQSFDLACAMFDRQSVTLETIRASHERVLDELGEARKQHGAQTSEFFAAMLELKRDGLVMHHGVTEPTVDRSDAGPDTDTGDTLPRAVAEAIDERSTGQSQSVRRLLLETARREVRAGRRRGEGEKELSERVERLILEGEDTE